MAELTQLETKLAEILGLAQAAQSSTGTVIKLVEEQDQTIAETLQRMQHEAAETEQRCTEVAGEIDGKKTAIQEKARETKSEAEEMMKTYLGDDADPLDGLEFLLMAEAGELGHVEIAGTLNQQAGNQQAGNQQIQEVLDWARPIQERHFTQTREAALALAQKEGPNAPA